MSFGFYCLQTLLGFFSTCWAKIPEFPGLAFQEDYFVRTSPLRSLLVALSTPWTWVNLSCVSSCMLICLHIICIGWDPFSLITFNTLFTRPTNSSLWRLNMFLPLSLLIFFNIASGTFNTCTVHTTVYQFIWLQRINILDYKFSHTSLGYQNSYLVLICYVHLYSSCQNLSLDGLMDFHPTQIIF